MRDENLKQLTIVDSEIKKTEINLENTQEKKIKSFAMTTNILFGHNKIIKLSIILFLFVFQLNFEGWSQTVLDLPSNTSSYTVPTSKWKVGPVYTNKNYYCAANLYLSSEIGTSGSITNLEYLFYHVSPASVTSREIEVYMGEIPSSTLSYNVLDSYSEGFITSDNMTKVFDGPISLIGPTGAYVWESIPLDTPFSYGGSDNLVIMYYDKTGATTGTNSYSVQVSTNDNRSLGKSWGSSARDTENPGFALIKTHVPRIRLTFTSAPSLSYSSSTYCISDSDPTPTLSGNAGAGTYSSTTGLSINSSSGAIDLSASTQGSFTVTYTDTDSQTATFDVSVSENTFYVSTTGSDSNNGLSTGSAFATIQKAIDVSNSSCGTLTVYVADGTYNENDIDIDESINIIGESESGTIIDNNDVSGEYCFKVTTDEADVSIKNITIRDFKGDAGCAFRSYKHDNKVVFDAVTINSCYVLSSATYDAAVFIYHGTGASTSDSIVMKNCTFSDNYSAAADHGTALYVGSYNYDYDYSVLITNCVFDDNESDGSVYSYGACHIDRGYSAEVINCVFKNNTGHGYNSGLSLQHIGSSSGVAGRSKVENCLFFDNSLSFAGAAMGFDYAKGTLTNCTFAQNSNTNSDYYYVSNLDINNSTIAVNNCIFQSDDSGNEMISGGTLSYCLINGGAGGDTYTDGGNNSTSDPLFSDAASNDFTLTSASPAVDAGTSGGPALDILGVTRDGSPDMGCYEYSPNNWNGTISSAWVNSSNWSRGTVPGISENITIPDVSSGSGNDPIITSDVTLGGITINSGASLTISSNSLTVTGTMDINDNLYIDNATVNADGTFDATGGTIDFTNANGKLILSSTVTSLGNNLDATMGTVEYDGATQTVFSDNYYNLTISTLGTKTAGGAINIDGDLTTAATVGSKLDMSTYTLNLAGDITVGATDGLDVSDALSIVTFDGSSEQIVTHEGSTGGSSTVTLVSEDFNIFSTGSLTESVSTTSTYQNVADCTSEKWEIESSNSDYAGSCLGCSGNRAHIEYLGISCTQDNTIITAEFSPTTSALDISFNYAVRHWGGQYFEVYLYNVTDATQVGTDLINITSSVDDQTYSAQTTLSGSNSTSDTYSLRFHYYGNNDYGAQFDNVLIQEDVTTSGAELNNCTINKSGGNILLNDEISVDGTLTFTAGDIDASSNNLVLTSAATVVGGTDASHVLGTMVKTTAATSKFTFPVGDGTQYKAISITPENGTSTEWSAKYFNTAYSSTTLGGNAGDIDHVSIYEYWDLDRTGSDAAKVEIPWVALNEIEVYADLRLAHWDSGASAWEIIVSDAVGSNYFGNLTSQGYQNSFSPFTLGSSSSTNVLPIELVSFSGEKKDNRNILNWTTASEINNAFFTVEKSYNGIDFEWVGTQEGTSPSTQIINYSLPDFHVLETLNYYRLKQTDFDGKFEYSNTISIDNRVDNSFKEIIGRINLLGQDVDEFYNGIVIIRYKDGTSQKFYQFK